MANLYSPESLGIKAPSGGFSQGGWYAGRQFWGGQFSDAGVINPLSNQQGAGQAVSSEVNKQSDAAQGLAPGTIDKYVANQNTQNNVQPTSNIAPSNGADRVATPGGINGPGVGLPSAQPALNLPDLYKGLSSAAGIDTLEKGLSDKAAAFATAQSKINDNPFLSEGSRTGRIAKLQTDYNANVKNDQDALAMKKQDIATQIDLQTKQFDINSQTAKAALDQFNTLLQSGALAGASGSDIASITASTGISSSMIQAAISSQQTKDTPTSVSTVDDGKNIYSVVINTKTGAIISKQAISASKPEKAAAATADDKTSYYKDALRTDAAQGAKLGQIFSLYTGYLDPNVIYQLYNSNSKYGPDNGDISALSKYGVTDTSKMSETDKQLQKLSKL